MRIAASKKYRLRRSSENISYALSDCKGYYHTFGHLYTFADGGYSAVIFFGDCTQNILRLTEEDILGCLSAEKCPCGAEFNKQKI